MNVSAEILPKNLRSLFIIVRLHLNVAFNNYFVILVIRSKFQGGEGHLFTLSIRHVVCITCTEICRAYAAYL